MLVVLTGVKPEDAAVFADLPAPSYDRWTALAQLKKEKA